MPSPVLCIAVLISLARGGLCDIAVQRAITTDGSPRETVVKSLVRSPHVVILGCLDPWWQTLELDAQIRTVTCIDVDCAALQRAKEVAAGTVREAWQWHCMDQASGQDPHASDHQPQTAFMRSATHVGCHAPHCAAAFLHPRDTRLPLSVLIGLTTYAAKARWIISVTPATGVRSQRIEVSVFDRVSKQQRIMIPSHNSFNQVFGDIYIKKAWGPEGHGSGPGSSMNETATIRTELPKLLNEKGVTSMLDSSCGGMLWMPMVLEETEQLIPGFRYHGQDVVCALIESHKQNFSSHPNWEFACSDASHEPISQGWDLIFSRDSFQHLPLASFYRFLHNVKASNARYLLIGSYLFPFGGRATNNWNIEAGAYFPINVMQPPFNLRPGPIQVFEETSAAGDRKHMLLFDVPSLQWDEQMDIST